VTCSTDREIVFSAGSTQTSRSTRTTGSTWLTKKRIRSKTILHPMALVGPHSRNSFNKSKSFVENQRDQIGKNLPFGQKFLALGNFFSRKKLPNDLGKVLVD
jgi:hypothetical protein